MLQMGEYSARQQLKLSAMESEVRENQSVTAAVNHLAAEKRQLQDMSKRLTFSLTNAEQANLSEADAARVAEIQQQLGVTPRGSIKAQNVREVRLYKDAQTTRLGIIFHQSTPAELGDVSSDATPRAGGRQPVVLPVIKVLDKAGIAGNSPDLHEGDQVLSVNGHAALSNVQTVQMLRDAVGSVVLAARQLVPQGLPPLLSPPTLLPPLCGSTPAPCRSAGLAGPAPTLALRAPPQQRGAPRWRRAPHLLGLPPKDGRRLIAKLAASEACGLRGDRCAQLTRRAPHAPRTSPVGQVRETAISKTPRGITPVRPGVPMTGLRVVNPPR